MTPLFVTRFLQFSQVSGYLGNDSNDNSDRKSVSWFWLVRRCWITNCQVKERKLRSKRMSKGCLEDEVCGCCAHLGTTGTPGLALWESLALPGCTACRLWMGGISCLEKIFSALGREVGKQNNFQSDERPPVKVCHDPLNTFKVRWMATASMCSGF